MNEWIKESLCEMVVTDEHIKALHKCLDVFLRDSRIASV